MKTDLSGKARFIIYCDGACSGNPGPGGWGALVADLMSARVVELGGGETNSTNNRMELTAATEALRYCRKEPGDVILLTDSVYVIRGITQWIWGWKKRGWKTAEGKEVLNQALWETLLSVVSDRKGCGAVEWRYVRGHRGTVGNEIVDQIAVSFSQNPAGSALYSGSLARYKFDVSTLPPEEALPEMKDLSTPKALPVAYLSLVGNVALRHATWAECERRVKGQSGAKFKKAMSEVEVDEILKSWGVRLSV